MSAEKQKNCASTSPRGNGAQADGRRPARGRGASGHLGGARPDNASRWEKRIDWILYRDGADAPLTLLSTGEERASLHDGAPLSDHPTIFARFGVPPKR